MPGVNYDTYYRDLINQESDITYEREERLRRLTAERVREELAWRRECEMAVMEVWGDGP